MANEYFTYQESEGFIEGCRIRDLAERFGTPLYLYSENAIRERVACFQKAFAEISPIIRYSCKANSNPHLLKILKESGCGADVISPGELSLALYAGFTPGEIIMGGVGKRGDEITFALKQGVTLFSVESLSELQVLSQKASEQGRVATALLRLNPDIPAGGHHYISTGRKENKFGLTEEEVISVFKDLKNYPRVRIGGLHLHLGSQIANPEPYLQAISEANRLHKIYSFECLDLGGGFPVTYESDVADIEVFSEAMCKVIMEWKLASPPGLPFPETEAGCSGLKVIFEPGRFFVAGAGFLLTRVTYRKDRPHKKFLIVDAGMNDLIRPALYEAYHHIWPVRQTEGKEVHFEVVGPVCESGDFLAKDRPLPEGIKENDLLLVGEAGAYGFAMSSNYNGRLRPAEVMLSGEKARLIRARETLEDLYLKKP
ncbi:MAG: diaminopimelate decarboxylase [Candidatus Omnitrophota bacterium]